MRIVGALPAGRLVDRFGEPVVMATGITIVAGSSILAGFSGSFTELIILRGAGGLGSAMFGVSAQTLLLVSVPSEQRGRASGLYAGGFLVGGISGPAVGGLIAAWSMRAPFIIYGCLLVVPAAIAIAVLRDGSRRPTGEAPPPAARGFAEIARALRDRAYRAAAGANLADGFAAFGVRAAIVPLFVRDVLQRSAVWTGIGFGVVAVLNAATLLPVGDILGGQGGTVVAAYQMAGDIGSVTGPVSAGYLVDVASYGAAFGLAAGVLGLAAVLGLFAPETRWRSQPAAPPPRPGGAAGRTSRSGREAACPDP
jgi:MFS family permease